LERGAKGEHKVYAAIRRYRVDSERCSDSVNQVLEGFVPVLKQYQGILGYYVLDAEDGVIASITIGEDKEKVEESSRVATEWVKQTLVSSIANSVELHSLFVGVEESLQGPLYEGFSEMCPDGPSTQLLSVQEVSEVLGMGKSWVYQQIRSGKLPSIQLGGSIKVEYTDLEEYLDKRRRRAARE
jgi:excisionase family DNA binding protein